MNEREAAMLAGDLRGWSRGRGGRWVARYPDLYAWLVLAGTLDILVTHTILRYFAGHEVNAVADGLIRQFGVWGMVALKYLTVIIFVLFCELVGTKRESAGLWLIRTGIAVAAMPVGIGFVQIYRWINGEPPE
jgi:nitric oxide reductase large subunit